MAHLYKDTGVKSLYSDRKFMGGKDGWQDAIESSTTLYIGNLSFYTTEEQAHSAPPAAHRRVTSTGATAAGPLQPDPRPGPVTPAPTLSRSTSSSHGAAR